MEAPYSVRLDADQALNLVKQGTSLLLVDVPSSLSFGIDLQMFVTGPNFKGMKMIPPGPHFVYYSASNKEGHASSPITGFFIYGSQSEVIVRQWDSQQETFTKMADSEQGERLAHAVRRFEFDRYLAPYDVHHFKQWEELSKYITPAVIERFEPLGGDVTVIAEAELVEQHPQTTAERRLVEQLMKGTGRETAGETHNAKKMSRCCYTDIPRLAKHVGLEAKDLTSLNMDKSGILETALRKCYDGSEDLLLGELQFSYVAFLMGQSLESFNQWKSIVSFMLNCQEAPLRTRTHLFVKFLDVLYHQLRQGLKTSDSVPFLEDTSWFTGDNFFRLLSKEFILMVKNAQPVDGDLLRKTRRLKELLEKSLGWDFENEADMDDEDEYAPVVVMEDSC